MISVIIMRSAGVEVIGSDALIVGFVLFFALLAGFCFQRLVQIPKCLEKQAEIEFVGFGNSFHPLQVFLFIQTDGVASRGFD